MQRDTHACQGSALDEKPQMIVSSTTTGRTEAAVTSRTPVFASAKRASNRHRRGHRSSRAPQQAQRSDRPSDAEARSSDPLSGRAHKRARRRDPRSVRRQRDDTRGCANDRSTLHGHRALTTDLRHRHHANRRRGSSMTARTRQGEFRPIFVSARGRVAPTGKSRAQPVQSRAGRSDAGRNVEWPTRADGKT